MWTLSRREFMKTGMLAAGAVLLPQSDPASRACTRMRYSLATDRGRRMLTTYADSVRRMNSQRWYPESNPLSWTFQWYTHMVRGDRTKAAELARIYPAGGATMALANDMWNTCQSHLGQPQEYFLPWHRLYLICFEDLIRAVSGDNCFTLPYWDYTDPAQQALPIQFRQPGHYTWGALYRADRYAEINAGTPLPAGPVRLALDLACMKSGSYNPQDGDAGFCANLDSLLHGAVHLDIGTKLGMGAVPWAANDPVFWVHHCNIDRIWASWNAAGGSNPSDSAFLDKTFTFADSRGQPRIGRIGDVLAAVPAAYDAYLDRPAGSLPFQGASAQRAARDVLESNAPDEDGDIRLGELPAAVGLHGPNGAPAGGPPWLRSAGHLILAIEGRRAMEFVGAAFNVYVHGVRRPELTPDSPAFVGQLNFFGLESMHGHDGDGHDSEGHDSDAGKDASFVLRDETRAFLAGLHTGALVVTLQPTAPTAGLEVATVRRIALVPR
ncbi:common central domain of tyrosinase [Pseudoduganella flava]|nr:tyrosinase family protein [Pseudoduganella flava]TWI43959.1 common central domain of tyrosinase [Pseudoduganella flava]